MKEKKISLVTYVLSLMLMALLTAIFIIAILKENKEQENVAVLNNSMQTTDKGGINSISSNVENENSTSENKSQTVWEEYPNDMNQKNEQWLGAEEDNVNGVRYNLMKKTIYSLSLKNAESFQKNYFNGDSTGFIDIDSNYARYVYPDNENNDLSSKYTKKIEYNIAVFNEQYYDGYYDLATCVKNQYNELKDKNYYYQVNKLAIMNGNNESKQDYLNNARAKKIKVTVDNNKEYTFDLEDTNKVQLFDLNYKQDTIETPVKVEIEVLEKYDGEKTNDVYISDVQCSITSNIPQGR